MSSLKDIMDVDVEPFESQAYRRSREAQKQAARFLVASSSEVPSSPVADINRSKSTIKRRRSNRVSKTDSQAEAAQSKVRRRSSATGESMDFTSGYQAGESNQASNSGSPQQSPRGSDAAVDMPVKYTPVTGRISRAKKGVPVHTCDICRPIKTFTRAEHLRRHQLSHQKPAYPCTFEDCERAFHRPDLLARHLQRHVSYEEESLLTRLSETQGEKPYEAGDPSSRASSTDTGNRTHDLKVETPATLGNTMQISPIDSMTPRTSRSGESSMTAASFNTITRSFQAVNFSPSSGYKRSASQAQLPESELYSATSPGPGPSRQAGSFDRLSGGNFVNDLQQPYDDPFVDSGASQFPNYTTTPPQPPLPLLRIPEENWIPGLSYSNSPWCSSASDSTYSVQSDLFSRDRSQSLATLADWPVSAGTHWSPHGLSATPHEIRSPAGFDSGLERFESPFASPRMSSPITSRGQLLDVPNTYGSFYMDTVGTPLPKYLSKPVAQHIPASPARTTNPGLDFHGKKGMAILLTECFTRFRGRKSNVRLSRHFEELYSRLLHESDRRNKMFSDQSPGDTSSADDLLDRFGPQFDTQASKISSPSSEWYKWINNEARQRLLGGCFIFDIHQSMYHQQPRARAPRAELSSLLRKPCPENLWVASNPSEWQAQRSDSNPQPIHLIEQDIDSQAMCSTWSFNQTLVICWFVSRLPPQEDFTYPNEYLSQALHPDIENFVDLFSAIPLAHSYMAMYHTPLRSLLAVAGDTWIFAQKISSPSAFRAAQLQLKTWSSSFAAAQATHHACQIIFQALSSPTVFSSDGIMVSPVCCISDYWSLYVSALICWSFGHRYQDLPTNGTSGTLTRSNSSTQLRAVDTDDTPPPTTSDIRIKALTFVKEMLQLSTEELITSKAGMKRETAGIIDTVRQQLELENVGNKCGLLVDSIVVLGKLRKTASKTHWF